MRYILSSWRPSCRQPPAMGMYVTLACCMVVLGCLLPPASSEHKKKIIVKVPHLIKHIHHDHFKPIHMHKVRSKKIEHHYHDEHEDTQSGWKHGHKKGKQNLEGSFSDLKPILLHQQTEEHMEYPGNDGESHEFDHNQRVGHRLEFEQVPRQQFSQEDVLWNPEERPSKRRPKFREESFNRAENFKRENSRPRPIDFSSWLNEDEKTSGGYSGEIWDIPSEDLSYTRNQQRTPTSKQFPNNGNKNKKSKSLNWRSKEVSSEIESDGWKPMVDFNVWNNPSLREPNNHNKHYVHNTNHNKHFIASEEYMTAFNENLNHPMQEERPENDRRKNRKQNRKKNKQINKHTEYLDQEGNRELVDQKLPQHPYQIVSPQSPILPQIQPQFFQPLQPQQIQPYSIPVPQAQRTWPQPNWPAHELEESFLQQTQTLPQQQQLPLPLQPQPTLTPKVVWSGHHLQMPQHSMWHVQQHSDGAPPLQVLTVNQSPLQPFQLPQTHALPQQLTQESSHVHQVVSPGWPLTRKSQDSSVKQHWEQHVQTSGSDGPASSYRVEVINYTDKKRTR